MSSIPKMIDCEPQTIPKNPTLTFGPDKKIFQVLSACVAISSAQLVGYPNGAVVPADTPAVAAAKAAFYHAGGAIHPVAGIAHAPVVYAAGPLISHAMHCSCVPAEPADVVAARQAHLAAHASA